MTLSSTAALRPPVRSALARACDTLLCGLTRRGLRLGSLAALALLPAWQASAGNGDTNSEVVIGLNAWLGSSSSDWFDAHNWDLGLPGLINLPYSTVPTAIGPIKVIVNGVPTGFLLPQRQAVLGGMFTTPSFTMFAFDGISQLRLSAGAVLDASTATIGQMASNYAPSGAVQAATVVLDGGQTSGSWTFLPSSQVVVNGQYAQGQSNWAGTLGTLVVNSGATFALNSSLTIHNLVNNSNLLVVNAGSTLQAAGSVANNGTLTLAGNSSHGDASFALSADTTLAGNGTTLLRSDSGGYSGRIDATSHTLTIGAGQTVRGSGSITGAVVNQGTLRADGTMRLAIGNTKAFDNSAGLVVLGDGATLAVESGALVGGSVQSLGNGVLVGGTFWNLALAGNLAVAAGSAVTAAGTLANSGVLTVAGNASNGNGTLYLGADTTLAGGGSTVLGSDGSGYGGNIAAGYSTLTIGSGHTLRGTGAVTGHVVNQGLVVADGQLLLALSAGGVAATFDNSAGLIQVANGATLTANTGTLRGGGVQSQGTARLAGNATFVDLLLQGDFSASGGGLYSGVTIAGSLAVVPGGSIATSGTVINNGTLTIGGNGSNGSAVLGLTGNTTLAGSGTTLLTGDAGYHGIMAAGYGSMLTIGSAQTVRGAGTIDGSVVNLGTVVAEGQRGLSLSPGSGKAFDNSGGLVRIADGSLLSIDTGSLSGGTLRGPATPGAGGLLTGSGSFVDLALDGNLAVRAGGVIHVGGTLTNSGVLTLNGNGSNGSSTAYLTWNTALAGSGTTLLASDGSGYGGQIANNVYTLTVAGGHTLRGSGTVFGNVVNQGRIVADGSLLLQRDGGGVGNVDNSAGLIQVANGATLALGGSTALRGGTVQSLGSGTLAGGGSNDSFSNLTLAGNFNARTVTFDTVTIAGSLSVAAGDSISSRGTLTNNGLLRISGNGSNGSGTLYLGADTTLAGGGSTVLGSDGSGYGGQIANNVYTLTVASGHTLRGSGTVFGNVVNQGRIVADGTLLLQRDGGGVGNVDNSAGLIQVADGATLALGGSTALRGGTVQSLGSGTLAGGGGNDSFSNLTLAGNFNARTVTFDTVTNTGSLTVAAGSTVISRGTLTNNGLLSIAGNGSQGQGTLVLADDTTLAGTGTTWLSTSQGVDGHIATGGQTLTVAHGQTLGGAGSISGTLVDHGTLAPGDTIGRLTLTGSLTLASDALLAIDAAGLAQGTGHDWLAINGNASLAGSVNLAFTYDAQVGDSFTFLTVSGIRTGSFDAVTAAGYQLSLSYGANDVTATVTAITAVPEPASWALLAGGLLALAGTARRARSIRCRAAAR